MFFRSKEYFEILNIPLFCHYMPFMHRIIYKISLYYIFVFSYVNLIYMIVCNANTCPCIDCIGKNSHLDSVSKKELKKEKNAFERLHLTFLEHFLSEIYLSYYLQFFLKFVSSYFDLIYFSEPFICSLYRIQVVLLSSILCSCFPELA